MIVCVLGLVLLRLGRKEGHGTRFAVSYFENWVGYIIWMAEDGLLRVYSAGLLCRAVWEQERAFG
jgi:hypothetical protein